MTAIIAMKAKQTHQDEVAMFDTDAKAIRIDNCSSFFIFSDKRDFITPLKKVNKKLKGLGGILFEIYSGTIKWLIEDDDGVLHDIVIPNGLYVKESPSKLLPPQHWAQTAQDFKPLPRGTWCSTCLDCIQLHWNQRRFTKTVKLDVRGANITTMQSAPSYMVSHTFCSRCKVEVDPIVGYTTHLIPDDKDETLNNFWRPKHQMPRKRAWIGAKFRRHRSRLILTLLKAPTPQPSLRMEKTLQSGTIHQQNFFVGITS
jgi:hypothetical protein